ncbi:tryptophan dimethylallyltransferase family protein [Kitasatospora sp. NPDC092286]|uniref:tryptophan dimethylallyltransferase family protein n=1 Tax=Kitasatospora sp. NPDC092286 TaxID=3364087 RepID=UPI0038241E81
MTTDLGDPGTRPTPPATLPATGPERRAATDGFAERAARGLRWLGEALALGPGFGTAVDAAVPLLFDGWGHRDSRGSDPADPAARVAPFEYSLVLGDGEPELRIFLRPLPPAGNTTALGSWEQGWRILAELERQNVATAGRAAVLRDLFRPVSRKASFGLCLAATVRPDGLSGVKVYLDTLAQGLARNRELVGAALERLGHGEAWRWLRAHDPASIEVPMPAVFSLDLVDSPAARAKFYTTITERSAGELEERMARLSATARQSTAALLDALPAAGPQALAAPGVRPTLCWSLTARHPGRPEDATLYLPFNHYTPHAAPTLARLGGLLAPAVRGRVEALVARCAAAAPEGSAANPFHWAAAKLDRADGELTLYLAADRVDAAARAER